MNWAPLNEFDVDRVEIHPATQPAAPPPRRRNLNVLLVDDDEADIALILSVLRRHPNVSAAQATDAPEFALRQLVSGNQLRPDLLLLDIHMPRINGFEFLERLREVPRMANVPVVFLTTSRLAIDAMRTKESSALLCVTKPESYLELQSRLNGVIRRAAPYRRFN